MKKCPLFHLNGDYREISQVVGFDVECKKEECEFWNKKKKRCIIYLVLERVALALENYIAEE